MKVLKILLLSTLIAGCATQSVTPSIVVNESMLLGSWNCKYQLEPLKLEGKSVFLENHELSGSAVFSGTKHGKKLAFDIAFTGNWALKDYKIYEFIDEFKVNGLNEFSKSVEKKVKKMLELKNKSSISTVLEIGENSIKTKSKKGRISECYK